MLPIVRKDSNTNTKPLSMLHHRSINCHNINCCFWKAIDNAIFRMNQNAVILRLYRTASLLQNPYTGRMRQEHNRSSDIFREIHGSFSTHIARIPRSNSVKLTLRMLVPLYFQILHFANMAATSSSVAKPLASDNLISSLVRASFSALNNFSIQLFFGETAGHFVLVQQFQATLQFLFINSSVKRFYNPILQSLKIRSVICYQRFRRLCSHDVSLF